MLIDHIFDHLFWNFTRDISLFYLLLYYLFTVDLILHEMISIIKHMFRLSCVFYNWEIELDHLIQPHFKNEQFGAGRHTFISV